MGASAAEGAVSQGLLLGEGRDLAARPGPGRHPSRSSKVAQALDPGVGPGCVDRRLQRLQQVEDPVGGSQGAPLEQRTRRIPRGNVLLGLGERHSEGLSPPRGR